MPTWLWQARLVQLVVYAGYVALGSCANCCGAKLKSFAVQSASEAELSTRPISVSRAPPVVESITRCARKIRLVSVLANDGIASYNPSSWGGSGHVLAWGRQHLLLLPG
jgi:hypothetical protein